MSDAAIYGGGDNKGQPMTAATGTLNNGEIEYGDIGRIDD